MSSPTISILDLSTLSESLVFRDGVWCSQNRSQVSYPADGSEECFRLEDESFWFRHRNKCIIAALRRFGDSSPLLDVGGGNGFTAKGVQDAGIEAILLEPSASAIERAKGRGVTNLVHSTLMDAGLKANSISQMGAFDVIEHIEDDLDFLLQGKSVLRPGGRFFLTVPALGWLWSADDEYGGHFRRYTVSTLSQQMIKAGFEVEFATYFFSVLPLPIFLLRSLPHALKIKVDPSSEVRKDGEHKVGNRLLAKALETVWSWEQQRIANAGRIPFGSSCLMVARKS